MANVPVTIKLAVDSSAVAPALSRTQSVFKGMSGVFDAIGGEVNRLRAGVSNLVTPLSRIQFTAEGVASGVGRMATSFRNLRPTLDTIEQRGNEIGSSFGKASLVFSGVAGAIGGVGLKLLKTASEFEGYRAKLTAILQDTEKAQAAFDFAVSRAADTPFDVGQVVKATVSLETFGAAAQENLDRVLNLGAAFGDLDGAALAFSKAYSGSLEGFESLRNTYGISTTALKQYGAEVLKTGGIFVQSEPALAKARKALQAIVDIRFGDATEKRAQTLAGAFSNLQDAVTLAASKFGDILVPAATSVTRVLADVVGRISDLPQPLKQTALIMGGLALAFTGLTAGVLGLVSVGGFFVAGLASMANGVGVVLGALSGLTGTTITASGAIAFLGNALRTATVSMFTTQITTATLSAAFVTLRTSALTAFTTVVAGAGRMGIAMATALGPVGVVLGVIAAGLALVAKSENDAAERAENLGKEIDRLSKSSGDVNTSFRQFASDMQKAFDVTIDFSSELPAAHANVEALNKALRDRSPAEAYDAIAKLGYSFQDLEANLKTSQQQYDATIKQLTLLQSIRAKYNPTAENKLVDETEEERKAFEKLGFDVKALDGAIVSTKLNVTRLYTEFLGFKEIVAYISPLANAFDAVSAKASELDTWLKFAGREEDLGRLGGSLEIINAKLEQARRLYEAQAGAASSTTEALIDRLRTTSNPEEIKAITAILDLEKERDGFTKTISKQREDDAKKNLEAIKDETANKLQALAEDRNGLQERKKILDEALKQVEKGSDYERTLKQQSAENDKKITAEANETLAKSLRDKEALIAGSFSTAQRAANATAATIALAANDGVRSLEAWGKAHKKELTESPELYQQYMTALHGVREELRKAKDDRSEATFTKIRDELTATIDAAANAPAKLAAVRDAIKTLEADEKLAATADIRAKYHEQIKSLKAEELTITKEIEASEKALAGEVADLRKTALEEEIRLLEARKAAGEGVDGAINLKKGELQKARTDAIETERTEDLTAAEQQLANAKKAKDKDAITKAQSAIDLINERARLKTQSIERAVTIEKLQQQTTQTTNAQKESDKRVGIAQNEAQRVKQASGGATGPGATVDRQSAAYGGITPFGGKGGSGAATPFAFGSFFDNFGTNNRTIDRAPQNSTTANPFQDDATFRAGLPSTGNPFQDAIRAEGYRDGPLTVEQLKARQDAFTSDFDAKSKRNQDAYRRANRLQERFGPGQGSPGDLQAVGGGNGAGGGAGGAGGGGQTINDNRSTVINMQGRQTVEVTGTDADTINRAVENKVKERSLYDGSGR